MTFITITIRNYISICKTNHTKQQSTTLASNESTFVNTTYFNPPTQMSNLPIGHVYTPCHSKFISKCFHS